MKFYKSWYHFSFSILLTIGFSFLALPIYASPNKPSLVTNETQEQLRSDPSPSNPVLIITSNSDSGNTSGVISSDYAFASYGSNISIINISNPTSPILVVTVHVDSEANKLTVLEKSDYHYAYVSDSEGLKIFNNIKHSSRYLIGSLTISENDAVVINGF